MPSYLSSPCSHCDYQQLIINVKLERTLTLSVCELRTVPVLLLSELRPSTRSQTCRHQTLPISSVIGPTLPQFLPHTRSHSFTLPPTDAPRRPPPTSPPPPRAGPPAAAGRRRPSPRPRARDPGKSNRRPRRHDRPLRLQALARHRGQYAPDMARHSFRGLPETQRRGDEILPACRAERKCAGHVFARHALQLRLPWRGVEVKYGQEYGSFRKAFFLPFT